MISQNENISPILQTKIVHDLNFLFISFPKIKNNYFLSIFCGHLKYKKQKRHWLINTLPLQRRKERLCSGNI